MIPNFELIEQLYQSGATAVWRARSTKDHAVRILKSFDGGVGHSDALAKLRHEYQLVGKINHPHVIRVEALATSGGGTALVMEDIGGSSLAHRVGEKGPLALKDLFVVALGAAKGLAALHGAGIIHKDVSPGNLVLNLTRQQVKLIDFGISAEIPQESLQLEPLDNLEGTLEFLAPEQTGRIAWPVDFRSDFYSLGASLYYALSGQPPFLSQDPLVLVHAHLSKQPADIRSLNTLVPKSLAQVLDKLLQKSPDNRYQSAQGLVYDLEQCQQLFEAGQLKETLELGKKDRSALFKLPRTLFGRDRELALLGQEIEFIRAHRCRLCLVTGESGIGKSAVIEHAQNLIFSKKGLFFSGKFDQLQAKTPFSALLRALNQMLRHLLREPEAQRSSWEARIQLALGNQGPVLLSVLPELAHLIGPSDPVEALPAQEAQIRFNRTFLSLIGALSHPDYPLVLFLDDLQWADEASLNFLEEVLSDSSIQNLLLIGAYRHNEVGPDHYLSLILNRIQKQEENLTRLSTLHLQPLGQEAITDLVGAAFFVPRQAAAELADLLALKTRGNPFFLHSFLKSLYQDGAIRFVSEPPQWTWDLEQVRAQSAAENVLQLLLQRLQHLPPETAQVMGWAAVLSNQFHLSALSEVSGVSPSELRRRLLAAQQEGFVINVNQGYRYAGDDEQVLGRAEYRFQHDQVQSAARDLMDVKEQTRLHLKAARYLVASCDGDSLGERLFDVVRFYNEGSELVEDSEELLRIVRLNAQAASRSINANAYDLALQFAEKGLKLLGEAPWRRNPEFAYQLNFLRFQAYSLTSKFEQMDELGKELLLRSKNRLDRSAVLNLQMIVAGNRGFLKQASELAVEASSTLGLVWPSSFGLVSVVKALISTKLFLLSQNPEKLDDLAPTQDPEVLMLHEIMLNSAGFLYQHDPNLFAIGMMIWTRLALVKGYSPRCISGFVTFAIILMNTGSPKQAFAWSDLASRLLQRHPNDNALAKTRFSQAAFIDPWRKPIASLIDDYVQVIPIAMRVGDTQYAHYASNHIMPNKLWVGAHLDDIFERVEANKPLVSQLGLSDRLSWNEVFCQIAKLLQGRTLSSLTCDDEEGFNEAEHLAKLQSTEIVLVPLWYYIFKCFALVFFGHFKAAIEVGALAEKDRAASDGLGFMAAIDIFYGIALLRAAQTDVQRRSAKKQAGKYLKKLKGWAKGCEANFRAPALLLEAEINRFDGRLEQAKLRYQESIERAAQHNLNHFQALGCEWLAELYPESPYYQSLYRREAITLYQAWGAYGKVKQLFEAHPELPRSVPNRSKSSSTGGHRSAGSLHNSATFRTPSSVTGTEPTFDNLDFESLMKATQTLSEEIDYHRLQTRLFEVVIENLGAQHAWLLLFQEGKWQVVARHGNPVGLELPVSLEDCEQISQVALRSMIQAGKPVVFADAKTDPLLRNETYVQTSQVGSVLCQPLVLGKSLLGAIYLENNLITGCFTSDRLAVLQVIATQAAISLENARLFEETRSSAAQLEAYSQGLEQKVMDRTAELQAANETKDRFFSIIAHDLRGPIGSLHVIFQDIVQPDVPLEADLLTAVRCSTKNTFELLENLLTWARNQKGMIEVHYQEFDLKEALDECFGLLQVSASAKQIVLEQQNQLTHKVYADPSMITTVVRNLINNAIKYSKSDTGILVVAEEQGEWARVTVVDQGIGLKPEQVEGIFNPNISQLSTPGTNNERGTGLGLLLCQDFVNKNGGEIGVQSQMGQGSQFWFTLKLDGPLSDCPEEGGFESRRSQLKTILADDEALSVQASGQLLGDLKIPFDHAADGAVSVEMARKGRYDLIWMDIDMPGMDGFQATAAIRRDLAQPALKIVALTSYSQSELEQRAAGSPDREFIRFDAYLTKPPQRAAIEQLLKQWFDC